jgi:hypothetical protein
MASIRSVTVGTRIIDLHKFSGEIVDEKRWATTQVSGSGGGYNVGSGGTNPVSISSVSQTHDQFFLKNESGQEMAIELTDAGLAVRKGHRVTVFWGIIQGQANGPYVAVYNHTTNDLRVIEPGIQRLAVPPTSGLVPIGWLVSAVAFCFYGLGIIGLIAMFILGRRRKSRNQHLANTLREAVNSAVAEAKMA